MPRLSVTRPDALVRGYAAATGWAAALLVAVVSLVLLRPSSKESECQSG
jgi:hypothetical protein